MVKKNVHYFSEMSPFHWMWSENKQTPPIMTDAHFWWLL